MSKAKKLVREKFRTAVLKRDDSRCRMCRHSPRNLYELDAHHITDRNEMISGGYVLENGITLCPACHIRAESYHKDGESYPGYSPEDLYEKIESDYEKAIEASEKLSNE